MNDTDISETLAPKVDQITFEDFRPPIERVVTITGTKVIKGADQPVALSLAEFPGRPYKPGKSMRRVLAAIWGPDSAAYVGRKVLLYGDPSILFGGVAVGGIRIRAMSHMDKPVNVVITVKQGQKKPFTVQPLKDAPQPASPTREERIQAALTAIQKAPDAPTLANVWERIEQGGLDGEQVLIDASTARTDQFNQQGER